MNAAETREIVMFPCFFRGGDSGYEFRRVFLGMPVDSRWPDIPVLHPSPGRKTPGIAAVSSRHSFVPAMPGKRRGLGRASVQFWCTY
jgi:hypothetical protein